MYHGMTERPGKSIFHELMKRAMMVVNVCLGVKPDERVLVITDNIRRDLGSPLYEAALDAGADATYIEIKPLAMIGQEPPKVVADAMLDAEVIMIAMKASITHSIARKKASHNGARIASMPFGSKSTELVMEVFTRGGMSADYHRMNENMDRLASRLKGTKQAHVTTKLGTDLTIDYGGRSFYLDRGLAHRPGDLTNLPAGELYIAPMNANGTVVIDKTFGRLGALTSPLELTFKDGKVVSIMGDRAKELEKVLSQFDDEAKKIAEFAIGMNPKARFYGLLVEDEKVGGSVHIAIGNNSGFGGNNNVDIHMDGVISEPDLYIDGEKIELRNYL